MRMASTIHPRPEEAAQQPSRRSRRRLAAAPHGDGTHDAAPRPPLPSLKPPPPPSHAEDLLPLFLGCRHLLGDLVDRRDDYLDLGVRLGTRRRRHGGPQRLLEPPPGPLRISGALDEASKMLA